MAICGPGYFTDAAHQNHIHVGFKTGSAPDCKHAPDSSDGTGTSTGAAAAPGAGGRPPASPPPGPGAGAAAPAAADPDAAPAAAALAPRRGPAWPPPARPTGP